MKSTIDIQKEYVNKALEIIQANPDLPIIPLVNYEIIADDCSMYWAGSWGKAEIDSYYVYGEGILFRSDDRNDLYEKIFDSIPDGLSAEQEEQHIENMVDSLPWTKAIFIKIELPN